MSRSEIMQELCEIRLSLLKSKFRLKDLTESPVWAEYAKENANIDELLQEIGKVADDVGSIEENFTRPGIGFGLFRNRANRKKPL